MEGMIIVATAPDTKEMADAVMVFCILYLIYLSQFAPLPNDN